MVLTHLDAKTIANLLVGAVAAAGSVVAIVRGQGTAQKAEQAVVVSDSGRAGLADVRDSLSALAARVAELERELKRRPAARPAPSRPAPKRGWWIFGR